MKRPKRVLLQRRRASPRPRLKLTRTLVFCILLSVIFVLLMALMISLRVTLPSSPIPQRTHHRIKTTEASSVAKTEHSSSSNNSNNKKRLDELIQARQAARRSQARSELRSATTVEEWTRPFFDYNVPVQPPTAYNLPSPNKRYSNTSLIVLVLSDRNHLEQRQAIRETWGKGQALYFVVGGPNHHPSSKDKNDIRNDIRNNKSSNNNKTLFLLLQQEQAVHQDLIDSIHPDSYRSLPHKLKFGFQWIAQNYYYNRHHHHHHHHHQRRTNIGNNNDNDNNPRTSTTTASLPEWILKVDDDMLVRNVSLIEQVLLEWDVSSLSSLSARPRDDSMIVLGQIQLNTTVQRKGPWAESPAFTQGTYPPWPKGSCGYVVNRHVVEYIADNFDQMSCYQGEDSSLGIWLMQLKLKQQQQSTTPLLFYNTSYFVKHRICRQTDWLVLGHQFAPAAIGACYQAVAVAAAAAATTTTTTTTTAAQKNGENWNLTSNAKLIITFQVN